MKILDLNDSNTKEFLQKIGQVIVEVNHIESLVELLIWPLIDAKGNKDGSAQGIGRRITVNLSFMEKADLLRSLVVERKGEEFAKKFTERVYKKLQTVAEKRDDVAHSLWFIQYGESKEDLATEKINFTKAYKRGEEFKMDAAQSKVALSELEDILKLIHQAGAEIIHYGVNEL